jgi:hypothetical protein
MLSRGFALSSEVAINLARMFAYVVGRGGIGAA